jgi:dipeptidyl aminopeptidase/acylaminoacyl peptidase
MRISRLFTIVALSLGLALGLGTGCGKGKKSGDSGGTTGELQEEAPAVGAGADSAAAEEIWKLPEGTGSFFVGSMPPGATIRIDGRPVMEKTPNLFSADPGHYELSVELEGFESTPDSIGIDVVEGVVDSAMFKLEGGPLASYALIARPENEFRPRWSPDGKTIVYEAQYGANRDIYTIPITGGDPTRITFDRKADFDPCWTPDGQEIVFTSNRTGTVELWIVKADGSEEPRIFATGEGAEESATFSPDGKWLAFESLSKIWKMPAKGGKAVQVTKGEERHSFPDWSPDGKEISYTVNTDAGGRQIWAVNVKTGATRPLVADKGWSYGARWAPSGKVLVLSRRGARPDRNHDLWICSADGGDLTQITMGEAPDLFPDWSPDGHELVWTKGGDLWIMTNLPGWLLGESTPEGS